VDRYTVVSPPWTAAACCRFSARSLLREGDGKRPARRGRGFGQIVGAEVVEAGLYCYLDRYIVVRGVWQPRIAIWTGTLWCRWACHGTAAGCFEPGSALRAVFWVRPGAF